MSLLPVGWRLITLGEVAEVVRGVTYRKQDAASAPAAGLVPLLRATNIGDTLGLDGGLIYIPRSGVNEEQLLRMGDILLVASSGSASAVGRNAQLSTSWTGTFGAFCAAIRPGPELAPRFLAHLVRSTEVRQRWSDAARGTNINNLKRDDLLSTPVPVPPLSEQECIVEMLDDHLSRLDAGAAAIEVATRRANSLRESWLRSREALSQGPRTPLGDLLISPLRHGRSVPTSDEGFPVLRLTAIRDGRIDLGERKIGAWAAEDAEPFLVSTMDFLVARGSGSLALVGRGGLVLDDPDPVAYPDTAIRVRLNPALVEPRYLALIWDSRLLRSQIESKARTTAGIHKINQADLRSLLLPLPQLADQIALVHGADELSKGRVRLEASLDLAATRARSLRRALLQAAFSSRLTRGAADRGIEERASV